MRWLERDSVWKWWEMVLKDPVDMVSWSQIVE